MDFGLASTTGKVRVNDEDSILLISENLEVEGKTESRTLLVVADGMGGGEAGEIASRIATRAVRKTVGPLILGEEITDKEVRAKMAQSFKLANEEILSYSKSHGFYLMGTTATAALLFEKKAIVCNIGDSRTYVFDREGKQKLVTRDHSQTEELVESGIQTQKESKRDPRRNILTKALGIDANAEPDFYETEISDNDSVLLCCDGLWNSIDSTEIGAAIVSGKRAQTTADSLVQLAVERDGRDNVSMVLVIT